MFFITFYENAYEHYSRTKTKFYELLVVMCCISLNMQIIQSLLKFKIFIVKITKDSIFMFLVLNAVLFIV